MQLIMLPGILQLVAETNLAAAEMYLATKSRVSLNAVNPEDVRPYFRGTKKIFERIRTLHLPNIDMKYLSMGMTNSYRVAVEEGSNMIRIGAAIFGERHK